jgi:hypothetical protein
VCVLPNDFENLRLLLFLYTSANPDPFHFLFLFLSLSLSLLASNLKIISTAPSLSPPTPMYPQQSHPAPSSRPYTFPAHQPLGGKPRAQTLSRVQFPPRVKSHLFSLNSRRAGVARAKTNKYLNKPNKCLSTKAGR